MDVETEHTTTCYRNCQMMLRLKNIKALTKVSRVRLTKNMKDKKNMARYESNISPRFLKELFTSYILFQGEIKKKNLHFNSTFT